MPKPSRTDRQALMHSILRLLIRKGLKSLTMDLLASELSMSKRTLYEIFGSKHELISRTLDYMFVNLKRMTEEMFLTAPDTLTALLEFFSLQAEVTATFSIDFFRDMDNLYPEIKKLYAKRHSEGMQEWEQLYQRGVEEGVLRSDVNYRVLVEMLGVQMEAIKRMEDRFSGHFTLSEILYTINQGFLTSIASRKGLDILENYQPQTTTRYLSFFQLKE